MVCVISQMPMGPAGPELQIINAVVLYGGSTVGSDLRRVAASLSAVAGRRGDLWRRNGAESLSHEPPRELRHHRGPVAIDGTVTDENPIKHTGRVEPPQCREPPSRARTGRRGYRIARPFLPSVPRHRVIRSLQRTHKKDGTHDIDKPSGETHTHAAHALGYLVAADFHSETGRRCWNQRCGV